MIFDRAGPWGANDVEHVRHVELSEYEVGGSEQRTTEPTATHFRWEH